MSLVSTNEIIQSFYDNTSMICFIADKEINFLDGNQSFFNAFGPLQSIVQVMEPTTVEKFKSVLARCVVEINAETELQLRNRMGNLRWYSFLIQWKATTKTFCFFAKDVTKQVEEHEMLEFERSNHEAMISDLIEAEQRFSVLFEQTAVPHLLFDQDGIIDCNSAAVRMLGYSSKKELLSHHPADFSPEIQPCGARSDDKSKLMEAIAQKTKFHRFEWLHKKANGEVFPVEVTLNLVEIGEKRALLAVWNDLTEIKKQKQFIEKVTNAVPSIILIRRPGDALFRYVSNYSMEILGYTSDEILEMGGNALYDLSHSDDKAGIERSRENVWNMKDGDMLNLEVRLRHRSGQWVWCAIQVTIFIRGPDQKPEELLFVISDITKKKKIEAELEQERVRQFSSSKMAALGEMASGIAHEINNPLTVILGKAAHVKTMILKGRFEPEAATLALDRIIFTVERISKIIRGLRTFSRDGEADCLEPISLDQIFQDTLELCQERFKSNSIDLRVAPVGPDLKINCRAVQVTQVLVNLLGNAFDAVSKQSKRWVHIDVQENMDFIDILIRDSGPGIPLPVRDKIMQPFFTTKEVGKGTGLGLSISKGIMDEHKGSIFLDQDHRETCFVLRFPRVKISKVA